MSFFRLDKLFAFREHKIDPEAERYTRREKVYIDRDLLNKIKEAVCSQKNPGKN